MCYYINFSFVELRFCWYKNGYLWCLFYRKNNFALFSFIFCVLCNWRFCILFCKYKQLLLIYHLWIIFYFFEEFLKRWNKYRKYWLLNWSKKKNNEVDFLPNEDHRKRILKTFCTFELNISFTFAMNFWPFLIESISL